jgi:molecular chaperone GrpE
MENQGFNQEEKTEAQSENTGTAEAVVEPIKKDETDYKAKYFYQLAEMDNYRKRMEREKDNILKYGNEKLLADMVDVVDNFERTIGMLSADTDSKIKNIVTGLEMVRKQYLDVLSKNGLTQIESLGKIFDPNFHEAMAQEKVEGKPSQEIIKEYQKGYVLNGRLVRAAKVVISE